MESNIKTKVLVSFNKTIMKANHPKYGRCTAYFNDLKTKLFELGYECEHRDDGHLNVLEGIKFDKALDGSYTGRFIVRCKHGDFQEIWRDCKLYFSKTISQTRAIDVCWNEYTVTRRTKL